jgi:hypothetical protein
MLKRRTSLHAADRTQNPFSNLVGVCCGLLPNGHSISAPKSIDFKKKP